MTESDRVPWRSLTMGYVNWRGKFSQRRIIPISIRFGATEWHPEEQWLLRAFDCDKNEIREFALSECDFLQGAAP